MPGGAGSTFMATRLGGCCGSWSGSSPTALRPGETTGTRPSRHRARGPAGQADTPLDVLSRSVGPGTFADVRHTRARAASAAAAALRAEEQRRFPPCLAPRLRAAPMARRRPLPRRALPHSLAQRRAGGGGGDGGRGGRAELGQQVADVCGGVHLGDLPVAGELAP